MLLLSAWIEARRASKHDLGDASGDDSRSLRRLGAKLERQGKCDQFFNFQKFVLELERKHSN